jgi:hypothetical protein
MKLYSHMCKGIVSEQETTHRELRRSQPSVLAHFHCLLREAETMAQRSGGLHQDYQLDCTIVLVSGFRSGCCPDSFLCCSCPPPLVLGHILSSQVTLVLEI